MVDKASDEEFVREHCKVTFLQGFESFNLDLRVMNEAILSVFRFDETITFAVIKPLYCTYAHSNTLPQIFGTAFQVILKTASRFLN